MSNILLSNIQAMGIVTFTYDAANIAAADGDEDTVTIQGLQVGDWVSVARATHVDDVGIADCRVSAANTLSITWVNPSAGAVNAGAATYTLFWARPDGTRNAVQA